MIRRLKQHGLWPLPYADEIRSCVFDISEIVDEIGVLIKHTVIDRCGCEEISVPHGFGRSVFVELEADVRRTFSAHFLKRAVAEASGN